MDRTVEYWKILWSFPMIPAAVVNVLSPSSALLGNSIRSTNFLRQSVADYSR
jgi:hypothetical protein